MYNKLARNGPKKSSVLNNTELKLLSYWRAFLPNFEYPFTCYNYSVVLNIKIDSTRKIECVNMW